MFRSLESTLSSPKYQSYAPTLLRFALGCVFAAHAYAKVFIYTLPGCVRYFEQFGLPGFTVPIVLAIEALSAVAFFAGYRTRVAAIALLPVMAGALAPHLANGWMFTSPGGGWEYVAFLLVALAVQAILGDGAVSLGRPRQPPM